MQFKKPKATEKAIKMLFGRSQNCAVVVITILGLFLQGTNSSQLQEMEKPGKKPWNIFPFLHCCTKCQNTYVIQLIYHRNYSVKISSGKEIGTCTKKVNNGFKCT